MGADGLKAAVQAEAKQMQPEPLKGWRTIIWRGFGLLGLDFGNKLLRLQTKQLKFSACAQNEGEEKKPIQPGSRIPEHPPGSLYIRWWKMHHNEAQTESPPTDTERCSGAKGQIRPWGHVTQLIWSAGAWLRTSDAVHQESESGENGEGFSPRRLPALFFLHSLNEWVSLVEWNAQLNKR